MSIHKLAAGSGYTYLTRQVAVQDRVERGNAGLASYYTGRGEMPGQWVGSGMVGIEGLSSGDPVTGEHMVNLYGHGRHPLADQLRAAAVASGVDRREAEKSTRLGAPYLVFDDDIPTFRQRVAERMAEVNEAAGLDRDAPGDPAVRARVRTEVGVELFREDFGRDPVDEREVMGSIARHSRPRTTAVAGFDLTFSPVKSVSTLWAIADPKVSAAIERAHDQAVRDALAFLERTALFTREGHKGVRQVETRGLIGAAFTHRDSRSGDPDLHTHVAIANKVQTKDSGKWLSIDGRLLYKANVAASETYNTALEHHLRRELGLRFEARPSTDRRKREIREIVGVDARLNERWSSRRASITTRQGELTRNFHTDHGRPPTSIEAIALAQQATLETRQAKHEPRTLAEQRATWATEAAEVLGGERAVAAMTATALRQAWRITPTVDQAWMDTTAARIRDVVQSRRSHWQVWHVRAEALRQVRSVDLDTAMIDHVVDTLVTGVLTHHSVPLAGTVDALESVDLPAVLRRGDGSSVYTIAGSNLYTSQAILTAESRITARAGQHDGHTIPTRAVDLALLESTANGLTLNAGQATLVKAMATSGTRVQLAIAPAGAGKTTAIETLARAWTDNGGTLIALAPSAAAADVLATTITPADSDSASNAATDTLAKLAWHITHPDSEGGPVPDWVTGIGPETLVVIDEAGLADTLTLDTVIEYAISRGASVRLIGDDQQLAAVGAGGVLRDIAATHGAVHLSELMRFSNPAEAAASLALRDGHLEAIGFYLDNRRLHIGDQDTLLDDILSAWAADHAAGRDAIMLAPTRDLVATLNAQARTHRLAQASPAPVTPNSRGGSLGSHPLTSTNTHGQHAGSVGREVRLADGNLASVGDLIITRSNDRRLRIAGTDWVKNGDRWRITDITPTGAITAARIRGNRHITLPPAYVTASVDLGYATTIHTAQGVTADTSHTLLTGAESRQVAYTAATRGRTENHLYLSVVGDGDPHSVIRPEHTHPNTPTDLLEAILTSDDSARSATTIARDSTNPAALLGDAVARYLDTLTLAAEHHLATDNLTRLDTAAEAILSGLTEAPGWPTLRNRLILTALDGHNPLSLLRQAYSSRLIDDTDDPAAILNWRLTHTATTNTHASGVGVAGTVADPVHSPTAGTPGPLPWLPGIPAALLDDPTWGTHVNGRAAAVRYLRAQITDDLAAHPDTEPPAWAAQGTARPSLELLTDITLFRAAHQIDDTDRRPTGPPQHSPAARDWQNHLTRQLAGTRTPALTEWRETFNRIFTHPRQDPFTPVLAERLSAISRAGINTPNLIHTALTTGAPLPDDHQAAALWWRLTARLSPAVTTHATNPQPLTVAWHNDLDQHLDPDTTATLQASPWWPTLVTVINHALARGETLATILADIPDDAADLDPAQGLVWRVTLRNNPLPAHADTQDALELVDGYDAPEGEVNPFWDDPVPTAPTTGEYEQLPHDDTEPPDNTDPAEVEVFLEDEMDVDAVLTWAALTHEHRTILPPTDREIETALRQAIEADQSPVTPERICQLNQAALDFYTDAFPGSWAQTYLIERLRSDITGHPTIHPGYAPPGWSTLITHLRAHGATNQELTLSGLATTTRDGRLIDRFRDRLILPITHATSTGTTETLGFVARANPHLHPTQAGPKYLNTPDTVAFHKSNQLYVALPADPSSPARFPVLVEGPLDAIAVTIATAGRHIGYAPLGTALTETQARQLARAATIERHQPVLAFDNDDPGQHATRRAYWLLAQHGTQPHTAVLRAPDPADMLTLHGPDGLTEALQHALPASDAMLTEVVSHDPTSAEIRHAVCILATMPASDWWGHLDSISTTTSIPRAALERMLAQQLADQAQHPRFAAHVDRGERKSSMRPRSVVQRSLSPARSSAEISNHARHIPPMSP